MKEKEEKKEDDSPSVECEHLSKGVIRKSADKVEIRCENCGRTWIEDQESFSY